MMDGKGKLMSSMNNYKGAASGSDPMSMPGMVQPDKGFELKAGSNGKSSGAALPIVQHLSDTPSLGAPESGTPAVESDDKPGMVDADEGYEEEPVA